ncbi:AraC family transcriptional regulator [Nocardioides ferulae]|uniref:AraC family transcriptional regulator n=1 Tax=Nocardioides ferulae TaxID=2340821 RepID=UPI000EB033F5|nr:AraC family transcriptional regulator [Nocardioides ferulae]
MELHLEQPATRHWDFPRSVAGVAILVEHGARRGLDRGALLAGTTLAPADLEQAGREVTAEQELRVVRNLQHALGADTAARRGALGEAVGGDYHVSTFGILGFALLSSRTVLELLNLTMRFLDLSYIFTTPTVARSGEQVQLRLDGASLPPDVRDLLLARDATAIRGVAGELVPGGIDERVVHADPHSLTLLLDVAQLRRALPLANPQSLALAEQLCRDVVERRRRSSGTASRVRVLVAQRLASGAQAAEVATALGLSERTLRRRLAAEGTSYQRLLDEVRESLAVELLGTGLLSVDDVAHRLGYAEASTFIVAFRRWTGQTPGSLRSATGEALR